MHVNYTAISSAASFLNSHASFFIFFFLTSFLFRKYNTATLNEKKQFIVIAHDHTDTDALKRRLAVRESHLVGARALKKDGTLLLGGALLTDHTESGKMIGSVMIFSAESKDEVKKLIEK